MGATFSSNALAGAVTAQAADAPTSYAFTSGNSYMLGFDATFSPSSSPPFPGPATAILTPNIAVPLLAGGSSTVNCGSATITGPLPVTTFMSCSIDNSLIGVGFGTFQFTGINDGNPPTSVASYKIAFTTVDPNQSIVTRASTTTTVTATSTETSTVYTGCSTTSSTSSSSTTSSTSSSVTSSSSSSTTSTKSSTSSSSPTSSTTSSTASSSSTYSTTSKSKTTTYGDVTITVTNTRIITVCPCDAKPSTPAWSNYRRAVSVYLPPDITYTTAGQSPTLTSGTATETDSVVTVTTTTTVSGCAPVTVTLR